MSREELRLVAQSAGLRLVVAGGGTGGHVWPALAVIGELRGRDKLEAILWVGSEEGFEREAATGAGIPFVAIPTGKLRRYLSVRNLTDALRVPMGVAAARRHLRAFRPTVVLSTGGFVSVPTVLAARGIAPVLTHEQTAILGLANRINAKFAAVLALSFERTATEGRRAGRHVIVTGNPIRTHLNSGDRGRGLAWLGFSETLPVVYVTGGARGASPLNHRLAELIPEILQYTQILHQTGPASANPDAERLAVLRGTLPADLRDRYKVVDFVGDELPDVYAAVDLVVGRSGAGTVAELAYVGIPAILIPLPGAGGGEQEINAGVLGEAGGAIVLLQEDATPQRLRSEILAVLADSERRGAMADGARQVARPAAAAALADALLSLGGCQK
jgi:UDP-N-acetylglucosamine--N-acetylmuramyl-(pentapeptide) pyrophosphoryl-undecaprenol N-acetylglucosamine transferase